MRLFSKLSKISIPILIAQIKDLNKDCVKIPRPYFSYFPRNKPSKRVIVGSGQFLILNNSARPEMVIKMSIVFLQFFLKVLKLFECPRGDTYITAKLIIGTSFSSLTHNDSRYRT